MGHLIGQLLFGLIAGIIAKIILPGKDPGGCTITALLGLAGSGLFRLLTHFFLHDWGEQWHWAGAIAGTLLILIVYRIIEIIWLRPRVQHDAQPATTNQE
ncbi:MAG TPA: GlsB/YeaQ/YmgE family stress response membrane protein [Planctomycetota bacterium]|nr:GlsB/YeaQ/YmgE family stress response membrane protein [Planctomycetota bacterium]